MLAVVQTEDAAGNILSLKGVEMTAHQQGDKMAYAANGKEIDLGKKRLDWVCQHQWRQQRRSGLAWQCG